MKAYLIFFGSSQGFTSYFFDREQVVQAPEHIFKDLEFLEPKYLSTDAIDNKEILSRYKLTTNTGKTFSLVKLFSFAQAYNIPRIEGCLYGVALLSEETISLSKKNLLLLKAAKDNFARLSLNGLKFKSSDFFSEAKIIWNAIVNNEKGNLLDSLDLFTNEVPVNPQPCAYKVDKLFDDAILLDAKSANNNFVYFSEDLDHLKRAQLKNGASNFQILINSGNGYHLFEEPKKSNPPLSEESLLPDFQKQAERAAASYNDLKSKHSRDKQLYKKRLFAIGVVVLCLFCSTIYLLFFPRHVNPRSSIEGNNDSTVITPSKNDTTIEEYSAIYLANLFSENPKTIDTFFLLLEDLKTLNKMSDSKRKADSLTYFNKLKNFKRRANYLQLNVVGELFK